jgi:hypothetical protein
MVEKGRVLCRDAIRVPLERCRFCVHSTRFFVKGTWIPSPARAYCTVMRATEEVDLSKVEKVACDDARREGYRSITTIIS